MKAPDEQYRSSEDEDSRNTPSTHKSSLDMYQTESLQKAFHSKLFIDDCDLNVKLKALNEI